MRVIGEEQEPHRPATGNDIDGTVTGPVVQTGAVHGDIYFRSRRRRPSSRLRWLWVAAGLTVLSLIAYAVLLVAWPVPKNENRTATDFLRVNDVSRDQSAAASDIFWATASVLSEDQLSDVRSSDEISGLMDSTNGVPIGATSIGVVLEGISAETVIVQQITARVVDTTDAVSGTLVAPPAAGGPVPVYELGFDLDKSTAPARVPDGHGGLGDRFADDSVFMIELGEKYAFTFTGTVRTSHAYRWVVDLELLIGERHLLLTLGEDSPFIATGPAHQYDRYLQGMPDVHPALAPIDPGQVCPTGDCTANAEQWARTF